MPMFVPLGISLNRLMSITPLIAHQYNNPRRSLAHPRLRLSLSLSFSILPLRPLTTQTSTNPGAPGRTLDGSCQCGNVQFTLQSHTPVPYQLCACGICRKVCGYNGSVNLGGIADSLKVLKGKEGIKKYSAIKDRGTPFESPCSSERSFCGNCSTMLWLWDHHWPEFIHPFASAIDSELPEPDEMVCIMEDSKPKWVRWPEGKKSVYKQYSEDSLDGWHKKKEQFVE